MITAYAPAATGLMGGTMRPEPQRHPRNARTLTGRQRLTKKARAMASLGWSRHDRTRKSVTSKWIKKQVPCKPDWRELNYTCLFGPFDSYESSINFEKQCTGYSSQDEVLYEQYKIPEKRIRKKNPKYDTDSDRSSEVEDEIPPRKKTKYVKSTLQALPAMSEFVHVDNIHDTDIAFERETNVLVDPIDITSPIFIQLTEINLLFSFFLFVVCIFLNHKYNKQYAQRSGYNRMYELLFLYKYVFIASLIQLQRKMHRKLDMLIHTLQIQYKNENVNISPTKNEFLQMESVEEMKEFENILVNEKEKREQFVSIIDVLSIYVKLMESRMLYNISVNNLILGK
ncbi:uncharacterized protein LOC116852271 [Odontomachus brunneus]|uniref:uncharacterized protein LOC116852271 n=1 Tax=Odontomachus brunneus TaxID=486640 RepID=UPI0013F21ED5|nr:uncharacterized protein LOC116852271 [Odontomachus brunneus]